MIFITVGTHKSSFNRLLEEVDRLIDAEQISFNVIAQIGNSTYRPRNYRSFKFLDDLGRLRLLKQADIVITHAGAGNIIDSLSNNKKTIVVPRLTEFGEHTNDHQLELARALERDGRVIAVYDISELKRKIMTAKSMKTVKARNSLAPRLKSYLGGLR